MRRTSEGATHINSRRAWCSEAASQLAPRRFRSSRRRDVGRASRCWTRLQRAHARARTPGPRWHQRPGSPTVSARGRPFHVQKRSPGPAGRSRRQCTAPGRQRPGLSDCFGTWQTVPRAEAVTRSGRSTAQGLGESGPPGRRPSDRVGTWDALPRSDSTRTPSERTDRSRAGARASVPARSSNGHREPGWNGCGGLHGPLPGDRSKKGFQADGREDATSGSWISRSPSRGA